MSARDLTLIIAPEALADLRGIHFYTAQQWGLEQAVVYEGRLRAAISHLLRHPDMGQVSRRAGGGIHTFSIERHTVYYRRDGDTLNVFRILNYRQEFHSSMLGPEE